MPRSSAPVGLRLPPVTQPDTSRPSLFRCPSLAGEYWNWAIDNAGSAAALSALNKKENYEILSFVDGESFDYPLPEVILKGEVLRSAARLLKQIHDASVLYLNQLSGEEKWFLSPVSPMEVICHGDFAPYNVTISNSWVVGVFDFDTIHPGPRIADVAYAIYRFAPVMQSEVSRLRLRDDEILSKIQVFIDEYGIDVTMGKVFDAMVRRIERLIEFMKK